LSSAINYLGKYMTKDSASAMRMPAGARLHGHGGLDREQRREVRYRTSPYWVREALGTYADIRRAVGGWVDKLTGLFLESPWRVVVDGAGLTWCFKKEIHA